MNMTMEMADVIVIFEAGQSDRFDDEALAESFSATNVERRPIEARSPARSPRTCCTRSPAARESRTSAAFKRISELLTLN